MSSRLKRRAVETVGGADSSFDFGTRYLARLTELDLKGDLDPGEIPAKGELLSTIEHWTEFFNECQNFLDTNFVADWHMVNTANAPVAAIGNRHGAAANSSAADRIPEYAEFAPQLKQYYQNGVADVPNPGYGGGAGRVAGSRAANNLKRTGESLTVLDWHVYASGKTKKPNGHSRGYRVIANGLPLDLNDSAVGNQLGGRHVLTIPGAAAPVPPFYTKEDVRRMLYSYARYANSMDPQALGEYFGTLEYNLRREQKLKDLVLFGTGAT